MRTLLPQVALYDLRSPLGVPPAALTPAAELRPTADAVVPLGQLHAASLAAASAPPPLSLLCQQRFLQARRCAPHAAPHASPSRTRSCRPGNSHMVLVTAIATCSCAP